MSKKNTFVPTPYPRKQTDINTNEFYNQTTESNLLKKQLYELENKYNLLIKYLIKMKKNQKRKMKN